MGKVLLIEPDRITRQAIGLFLFPDHEVQMESSLGGSDAEGYDLLIVDGSALRERAGLTPEFSQLVQDCKTPTLWLEDDERERPIERANLLFLQKPIAAESFRLVLGQLLSGQDVRKGTAASPGAAAPKEDAPDRREVIDLLDVVEEESPANQAEEEPDGSS